ncbi:MAG: dimethylarginine dimethylaminohydrolase family protein [Anaerolineae bacterium]
MNYGSQSMVGTLKRVAVRTPTETFGNADPKKWHYTSQPDMEGALAEHSALVKILTDFGSEVVYHEEFLPDHSDSIFTHDPVIVSNDGAILLSMGKPLRVGEEEALGKALEKAGVPIHYRLTGEARAEGGDLLWVDEETLAVGLGFRTNAEGMRQLQEALPNVNVVPVHLPYFTGPEACLHLMSFISIVDHDKAVVYEELMPVPFWQDLKARGFKFAQVPKDEFWTMGPNVLAMGPGQCLMLDGNPKTRKNLMDIGCEVVTYVGKEISLKAEGGATCLTRPIWRD